MNAQANTWVEISKGALERNVGIFRGLLGKRDRLMAVVKADAYGHGATVAAPVLLDAGANWLGVFSLKEGLELRRAGIDAPILVLGGLSEQAIDDAIENDLKITLASLHAARVLADHPQASSSTVHLKVETGTNRQGLCPKEIREAMGALSAAGVNIEGVYTHFADIEDTTDHRFAKEQLERFTEIRTAHPEIPLAHTACTAAAILFGETYFDMVRVGIGMYGLWPSKETQVSAGMLDRNSLGLQPALSWKTRILQIKPVPAGGFVGYGRTHRATRKSAIAVLPIGYADGYDRKLSNGSHVIVQGTRAPVVGRVCMNMTMVDVTDIPSANPGDEVTLLGTDGDETICAEDLARLAGTINYETVTRLAPGAPRILVP